MLEDAEFWVLVAFVALAVALYRPVARALVTALDSRADRIRGELEQAAKLREEAQSLLAAYKKKHQESVQEAADIVARAREEADRLSAQAAKDLEAAVKRRERAAVQRIAQAEAQALAEVRAVAVDTAIAAARSLLAEALDGPRGEQVIDEAIAELPDKLH